MSTAGDGWRLATGTLTAVPVRPPRLLDGRVAAVAMVLAPVAVLPVALLAAGAVWLALALGAPSLASATLAVAVLALGTRGLHLDGLADTADGLACTGDRDRALVVMRQGDVGPAGAVALLIAVLLQVTSLAGLPSPRQTAIGLLVAVVTSRAMLAVACTRGVPSARPAGLGATVAGAVPRPASAAVLLAVGGTSFLALGPAGLVGTGLAFAAAVALLTVCVRRFGGVSGDVLGAVVEVAIAVFLLTSGMATPA